MPFLNTDKIKKAFDQASPSKILRRKIYYSPQGYPYASFDRRMFAAVIDMAILMLLLMPFNDWMMQFSYHEFKPDPAILKRISEEYASDPARANIEGWKYLVDAGLFRSLAVVLQVQYAIVAVYSYFFWHLYSSTPGKILLNMRIVDAATGNRISEWQSFVRLIGYLISAVPCMLGFFAISWGKTRQAWHDKLSGTVVVVLVKPASEAVPPSEPPAPAAKE